MSTRSDRPLDCPVDGGERPTTPRIEGHRACRRARTRMRETSASLTEQEQTVAGEETTVPGAELITAPRIEPIPAGETAPVDQTPTEIRSRLSRRLWDVAIGEWPSVWSTPPTEPAALVRYAAAGQWCAPDATTWRRLGQAYCVLLAIPVSVALYVAAWLVQRPGRLVAAAVLATIVWLVL